MNKIIKSRVTKGVEQYGLNPPGDNEMWVIATTQSPDAVGDVVYINGIDTKDYHNPPESYMKILPAHSHNLHDGSPAVLGRVEEFVPLTVPSKNGPVEALAMRFSWAQDKEGNLTELASKWAPLYASGYLDSFSIGFMPLKSKSNDYGGYDFVESQIHEVSAVPVPANPMATAMKQVKKTLGDDVDVDSALIENIYEQVSKPYDDTHMVKSLSDFNDKVESMFDLLKTVSDRLDVIESKFVVLSKDKAQSKVNQNKEPDLEQLSSALDRLIKFLD